MELLVSSRTPTRRGRLVCWVNWSTEIGGRPSSSRPKFCCCRPVMKWPCLSVTVKMRLTSLVSRPGRVKTLPFGCWASGVAGVVCAGVWGAGWGAVWTGVWAGGWGAVWAGVCGAGVVPWATAEVAAVRPARRSVEARRLAIRSDGILEVTRMSVSTYRFLRLPVALQPGQEGGQVGRQRRLQVHSFTGPWMHKDQMRGVQEVALELEHGVFLRTIFKCRVPENPMGGAVQVVADDGMAERLHVDANLVGAAGLDLHIDQGEGAEGGGEALE